LLNAPKTQIKKYIAAKGGHLSSVATEGKLTLKNGFKSPMFMLQYFNQIEVEHKR